MFLFCMYDIYVPRGNRAEPSRYSTHFERVRRFASYSFINNHSIIIRFLGEASRDCRSIIIMSYNNTHV